MPGPIQEPLLMGILNVTPDSFFDGGRYDDVSSATQRIRSMEDAGADIVDIGGESTRPGADPVSVESEKKRVMPVLKEVVENSLLDVSVDTSKPEVAEDALDYGIDYLNVVTGLEKPEMIELVSDYDCSVVIMHMQGNPNTMQENPEYEDVIQDIKAYLSNRADEAIRRGIDPERIVVDPGIGFGKRFEHNRKILSNISSFKDLGFPVMIGHSRKSFIGELLGQTVDQRKIGTLAVSAGLIQEGVDMLRVHDVREHVELKQVNHWMNKKEGTDSIG